MTEKSFGAYSITEDVFANRPATPTVPPGMLCVYLATDTKAGYVWNGSVWVPVLPFQGTPGSTDLALTVAQQVARMYVGI